ncbi:trimethylamine methyltransferase family protein [Aestuariicoccus sp. MJ-SS9]|uniref:trimethylamine methyltransferase family protein n=1 Tax=Aestuariicoccus sp. MJ-SS9 TaxID=3079855 RepID=UPI0029064CEC|nr:trimethylamine methyltransferase family protein [Aestuariicoccus sp. MJ-SS9]MDU8910637.1 trimethylamine methyltransferase family protein [Aestuariicoccus sp. MJ-SS9]
MTTRVKRRGRKERTAERAAPPTFNPCPPGQRGGQYRPLSEADCQAIHATALRLLSELGMGEVPDRLVAPMTAAGASMAGGRMRIPESLVNRAIALAAKRFTHPGRDPARSIELGGDRVHFGTGGAAVQVLDLDTARYRAATLRDLFDFTRLQDRLTNVSWFTRCCIATDMEGPEALDINTAFALLKGTTKPVATAFTLPEHVAPIIRMAEMTMDVPFAARPFLKAHISPIISPMRFGADAVDVTFECIRHGVPLSCITAAQSGATAPATLAGFLAQSHAETLASLVMVNVLKPGHPMVFSNWPLVIDLRSGAFAGGGGEISLLNAASAQLTGWLGLPSGVASSMTDAKVPDAQYGMEKALSSLAAGLSGANLIYESAGMTASLLGASFEAFVLDDEMLAHVYRMLRGVEVSEETLGYDAIVEAVLGEGHFLGGAQTLAAMERDYFYPALSDRATPRAWEDAGRQDAWSRANARARAILAAPPPVYLSAEAERRIRGEYDIRLEG